MGKGDGTAAGKSISFQEGTGRHAGRLMKIADKIVHIGKCGFLCRFIQRKAKKQRFLGLFDTEIQKMPICQRKISVLPVRR